MPARHTSVILSSAQEFSLPYPSISKIPVIQSWTNEVQKSSELKSTSHKRLDYLRENNYFLQRISNTHVLQNLTQLVHLGRTNPIFLWFHHRFCFFPRLLCGLFSLALPLSIVCKKPFIFFLCFTCAAIITVHIGIVFHFRRMGSFERFERN